MGHGHGHGHGSHRAGSDIEIARAPRLVLLGLLAVSFVLTGIGMVALWPDQDAADAIRSQTSFAAPGVTYPSATVESTSDTGLTVRIDDGAYAGRRVEVDVPPEVAASRLGRGDGVRLIATPATDQQPVRFSYFGTERGTPLWLLGGLFVLVVVAVARWRGLLAIGGLALGGAVIWWFMLPALLVGESGVLVGLTGSAAIMLVVLYTTHGVSLRTSTALLGTLAGLLATAGLAVLAIGGTHLTGISDESGGILSSYAGDLDFQGLLACAMVVAGLGVLNDVTITQASAVWELREAAPSMGRFRLFNAGMRIGRDHIASTIYTIAFAYAGAALTVLLVIQLYAPPLAELLTTEEIAQEIVRTLVTSIGLVLAVPLTTAVAVAIVPGRRDVAEHADH
ncbi:hypothetical protein GCM10022215_23640 [Nocardioides fonticola]|uniref:YibE/F family protein n=1 Tax=Nocardioides fonticola TaxID=450363 RepID=A0ABP7XJI6_9ACTN